MSHRHLPRRALALAALLVAVWALAPAGTALAQDPNVCDVVGEAPDLTIGDLDQHIRWGEVGGITAWSIATVACNTGTCWVEWFDDPSNQHPVLGQNMFRLKDGRMEQIGQSWLKHAFFAVSDELCSTGCVATSGDHLGVNCSDPYSAFQNGFQSNLGPKFEVDAATGFHPHPVTDIDLFGDEIYKRLQVRNVDVDPALNPGAQFFVEGQYLAEDDSLAGNDDNNASYRPVDIVNLGGGALDLTLTGSTVRELPAIHAWAAADATVQIVNVDVAGDGRLVLAAKATPVGGGVWNYEYALQNLNSSRAVGTFGVPVPSGGTINNIGFNDVDYHSGEPFSGADWVPTLGALDLVWATVPFATDPDANALRWGTLYNFRFDADVPPIFGDVTLGLFVPGSPASATVATVVPSPCNSDGTCDLSEQCVCLDDCPGEGSDGDGDSVGVCVDCNDADSLNWATPGEVRDVALDHTPSGTVITWNPPLTAGASTPVYDVLRSLEPSRFSGGATQCLADGDSTDTTVTHSQNPFPGRLFSYLIRALNDCPFGVGTLGTDSSSVPRIGQTCP